MSARARKIYEACLFGVLIACAVVAGALVTEMRLAEHAERATCIRGVEVCK